MPNFIYLASRSPRRAALLHQIGVDYEVVDVAVDESRRTAEPAADYVLRLARAKVGAARQIFSLPPAAPVLGADTAVALDDDIFGKPRDEEDALAMLLRLAGRSHHVYSAVAARGPSEQMVTACSVSVVHFRPFSRSEALAYVQSGESSDKAGAYAIQGRAALFVERIEGSYSGIMGLPLFETAALLRGLGVKLLNTEW